MERHSSLRPERLLHLSEHLHTIAGEKIAEIGRIGRTASALSINAQLALAQPPASGRRFAAITEEFKRLSAQIDGFAEGFERQVCGSLDELTRLGGSNLGYLRGQRLADLAFAAIQATDRSLHERSCDARLWATDPAIVACADIASDEAGRHAGRRLGRVLKTYPVYLDLWICDIRGRILATGCPDRFPGIRDQSAARLPWFQEALQTESGDDAVVGAVDRLAALKDAPVATCAAAIRAGGQDRGRVIGVLGIHFDWAPQARALVEGLRLPPEEQARSRMMLLDARGRVLAASDGQGILEETFALDTSAGVMGSHIDRGRAVGYARSPGYGSYRGQGWYGCLVQSLDGDRHTVSAD